jgi:hypothetical protein
MMRKLLIGLGLLAAVALLPAAPAKADAGCACVKFGSKVGAAPVCVANVDECLKKIGGLCLAPCDYHAPMKKAAKRHHHAKKKM